MSILNPAQQLAEVREMISDNKADVVLNILQRLINSQKLNSSQFNIVGGLVEKMLISEHNLNSIRIAVLGDYTTQPIITAIRCALISEGILAQTYEAPLGSYVQEILNPNSGLYDFQPEILIIVPDIFSIQYMPSGPVSDIVVGDAIDSEIVKWQGLWDILVTRLGKPILQHLYEVPTDEYLGVAERRARWCGFNFIHEMNNRLLEHAPSSLRWLDVERLASRIGRDNWNDSRLYNHGKFGFSPKFLPEYTTLLSAALRGVLGVNKKALIIDLDNTLWGGVIGDDGLSGIRLGPDTVEGEAYETFCNYIKGLGKRGVILGICSKNEFSIAREVFDKHPNMPLSLDDFAIVTCNWNDKASNLLSIAKELNIDNSALVFVDDNPAECELIRQVLPNVYTVHMDGDPSLFLRKLDYLHMFDSQVFSEEDINRSDSYQAKAKQKVLQAKIPDLDTYLISLDMKAKVKYSDSSELIRISQMEMKTNQFNLTTRRLSGEQILAMIQSENTVVLSFYLSDCFSEHGLVSYVAFTFTKNKIIITDWLMSCRVFSRTLEDFIFNLIVNYAIENKIKLIEANLIQTPKNKVMGNIFGKLGFIGGESLESPLQYRVISELKPLKCFIKQLKNNSLNTISFN